MKLLVDNTTVVTTINQMGTCHSRVNNQLSHQIWLWCIDHSVWLSVAHIPGKQNTEADRESRLPRKEREWTLRKPLFDAATKKLGVTPNVDLFASRLNFQLKPYVAYQPDPEAHAINAFHISWKKYTFYAFPPFSVIQRVLQKISDEEATGLLVVPHRPTQTWWPYLMHMLIEFPLMLPRNEDTLYLPAHPHLLHPLHKKLQLTGLPLVRDLLTRRGISTGAAKIILQSWRTGTQKQYQTYHQRWQEFCRSRGINPISASIEDGLEFLYQQYENGLSYSGINTARSALSTVIFLPDFGSFGNHPLVSRFLTDVFESRPSLPRYKDIWDVSVVLDYLKTLPPLEELNLKDITHKTVVLVALLSGQRCQTIHAITVSGMRITNDTVDFEIAKLLKTSKPGKHQGHLEFKSYPRTSMCCDLP